MIIIIIIMIIIIWAIFASGDWTLPLRQRNSKNLRTLFLWEIVKNATWKGRYRVELSCENPKVLFCTALGALLFRMNQIYLHKKFTFQSTTLLKLNYLYLLIIIKYPQFIRCLTANQVTDCYMSLFFTVKGTSEQTLVV